MKINNIINSHVPRTYFKKRSDTMTFEVPKSPLCPSVGTGFFRWHFISECLRLRGGK